ncbi:hypothetical protein GCM10022393_10420 [Aquimarina addita]|uniref:Minor curlin subunit n=1 Tax=Aquimarina addita TaxID=870485 RepID=A0ABP7XDG0_9FLAO
MQKNNSYYSILCCLFIFGTTFSQITEDERSVTSEIQEKLITLSQLENNITQIKRENTPSEMSTIFIQQTGVNNVTYSSITSQSSNISIQQNGEQNLIDINETAKGIEKIIIQSGNYNTVTDFSFNPDVSTNLELIQEGNNLYFERFGNNELSKNLQFKMTGSNRSIIIRSF